MNTENWQIRMIQLLSVVGILIAFYLVLFHNGSLILTCTQGELFDCGQVSGPYAAFSTFYGIPVAFFGLLGYVAIFMLIWLQDWVPVVRQYVVYLVMAIVSVALLFTAYLSYLEEFVIGKWCQYCLGSAAVVILMFILNIWAVRDHRRK